MYEACAVGPQIIFGFLVFWFFGFWFLVFGFLIMSYPGLSSAVLRSGRLSGSSSPEIQGTLTAALKQHQPTKAL